MATSRRKATAAATVPPPTVKPLAAYPHFYLRPVHDVVAGADFNPYDLRPATFADISAAHATDYYTISIKGVTHFMDDDAELVPMAQWCRHHTLFHALRRIRVFRLRLLIRSFSAFKHYLRRQKMDLAALALSRHLQVLQPPLQNTVVQVTALCAALRHEPLFALPGDPLPDGTWSAAGDSASPSPPSPHATPGGHGRHAPTPFHRPPAAADDPTTAPADLPAQSPQVPSVVSLPEFVSMQDAHRRAMTKRFQSFGDHVRRLAADACARASSSAGGVSQDVVHLMGLFGLRLAGVSGAADHDPGATMYPLQPRGLSMRHPSMTALPRTYAAAKRQVCVRLPRFLRLLQLMVADALTSVVVSNTVFLLRRLHWQPSPDTLKSLMDSGAPPAAGTSALSAMDDRQLQALNRAVGQLNSLGGVTMWVSTAAVGGDLFVC